MAGATDRPSRWRLGIAIAALAIAIAPAASAQGETDAETKARAKALLDEGDEQLRRGNAMRERGRTERAREAYESALDSYQSAFDAFPESRIYYPIARAEEQLGRYLDAHRHYQLVLDDVEELSDRLRAEVESRQETVRARIAAVHVHVEPAEARLTIDGTDAGEGSFDKPIHVEAGAHTVQISAEGHAARELEIQAKEGGTVQLVAALQPTPDGSGDERAPIVQARSPDASPSAPSRVPLAAGISATAGFGVAATVTGLLAVQKHGVFSDQARPADERQAARDTGQILTVATDVLLVATAAAAGYTAYYYYGVYRGERDRAAGERRASARPVWLAPFAADRGGGLAVGGRF